MQIAEKRKINILVGTTLLITGFCLLIGGIAVALLPSGEEIQVTAPQIKSDIESCIQAAYKLDVGTPSKSADKQNIIIKNYNLQSDPHAAFAKAGLISSICPNMPIQYFCAGDCPIQDALVMEIGPSPSTMK